VGRGRACLQITAYRMRYKDKDGGRGRHTNKEERKREAFCTLQALCASQHPSPYLHLLQPTGELPLRHVAAAGW